ncbi:MAG: hypothetical protein A4S09_12725 [Proteobacteria bacterium SG_bin7]|nr:MAG: hypothetical protein A4S09_12725 [Proteobacteria bacterium SG_bin7]
MQKISGILPGSTRVTSVDLKSSRPVRPGVPSFGAPQGESNLRDQVTRSQLAMQDPNSIDVPRWRSKEDANAEIAKNITDQFFRRRIDQPAPEITDSVTNADASAVGPGTLDMMDFAVDNIVDQLPGNSRGAAYFDKTEDAGASEGMALDTVA